MKYQQVTVDFTSMVFTACSYLALAGAVWILLRLVQACFWLPRHLKKQNNVQRMLQDKVDSYEKYILEREEKEKAMFGVKSDAEETDVLRASPEQAKIWKERRECLEMLKHELKKISEGDTSYDWEHLLDCDEDTGETEAPIIELDNDDSELSNADSNVTAASKVDLDGIDYSDSERKKEK